MAQRRLRAVASHLDGPCPPAQLAAAAAPAGRCVITSIGTRDIRFALPAGDGTDSVHSLGGRIYYGYGVTVLNTSAAGPTGHGLGFTLGAGTDMVCSAIDHLCNSGLLVGRDIEELMADFGQTFNQLVGRACANRAASPPY